MPLLALLSPILSGLSRLRSTALCLAPGRVDGAAAPRWARGRSRGAGAALAGGGAAPVGGARGGRGGASGGRKNAAKMPFEFPSRRAYDRHAIGTP